MRQVLRGRLRLRLIATLALVAAVTAVAVAGASYVAVRELRLREVTDTAIAQSRFNLTFAAESLASGSTTADIEGVVRALQRRGGFDTVVITGDRTFQSSLSLGSASIPADLANLVGDGRFAAARRTVDGRPMVVVGAAVGGGPQLWFFFPLDAVFADLETLGRTLAAAATVMVGASAAVGIVAARGFLRPIGEARDAAHRIEGGDLGTRLPAEGRDEFAELSRSFNAMASALERTVSELRAAEAGQRQFVADVSHELRTPVTGLAAAADALGPRIEHLPEADRRAARLLVREAQRLRVLVEDLMEISRFDAGAIAVEADLIDVGRLLAGAIAERGWSGRVSLERGSDASVEGDRRRLDRVFVNLVENALRHGAPPVAVSVRRDGDAVEVVVRDAGAGVPTEHADRIFDRFYKGDVSRARSAGSGLGLAIAAENVAVHGGSLVLAAPRAGEGACFTVRLPAVAEPLPSGDEPVTLPPEDDGIPNPNP